MKYSKILSLWLFAVAGLVFAMVIIGAITRLTESGLSMVEWRPLIGTLPPMNDAEWQRVFELYQQSPEYQKKNFWMEIGDFKTIFFWEWLHRFMGRFIGLAYGLPFLTFLGLGIIPKGFRLKLFFMLLLGGAQGLMGWFMVQSGLVDVPAVSHYRLAAHLGLAMLIFCLLLWLGLSIRNTPKIPDRSLYHHALIVLAIIGLTILWGAFVAGLDAGMIYNEYPLMGGQITPPDLFHLNPLWINFFENPAGVQFFHRWIAVLAVLALLSLWFRGLKQNVPIKSLHLLGIMAFIQLGLGITTILTQVNIALAALHQTGALLILMLLTITLYSSRPEKRGS